MKPIKTVQGSLWNGIKEIINLEFSFLRRRQARLQKELAEAAKEPLPVEP